MTCVPVPADILQVAVAALRRGEPIGLPTETVYGLAADARNEAALRRVFELKGRPSDHPLIVHIGTVQEFADWAREVPDAAHALARAFWPGPLTLILKRRVGVSDAITGGQDTVGVRMPAHPAALAVLQAFGGALAAPSANRFGHISPTTAQHVRDEFGAALAVVIDGGATALGIESTIVDLTASPPRILRPGAIGRADLEAVIGPVREGALSASPRVSGALAAHYAPRTATELLPRTDITARVGALSRAGQRPLVLAIGSLPVGCQGIALPAEAAAFAQRLYAALRQLDAGQADRLLIESPPDDADWTAIRDRLERASAA